MYAITGFILSARGLGWFKQEYHLQITMDKNIAIEDFKSSLLHELSSGKFNLIYNKVTQEIILKRVKRLAFIEKQNDSLFFEEKSLKVQYRPHNGNLQLQYKAYPTYLQVFISSHLSNDQKAWFYLALVYSMVLSFFAISSIFIVKGKYGFKRRGIFLCIFGIVVFILFLFFSF